MTAVLIWLGLTVGQAAPLAGPTPAGPPAARYDVLVVAPRPFWEPLAPWVHHRQGRGHAVALVEPPASAGATDRLIAAVAADHPLTHVLLVGRPAAGPWGLEEADLPTVPRTGADAPPGDRATPPARRTAIQEAARFERLALAEEPERALSALPVRHPAPGTPTVPTVHVRPRVNLHWGGEAHAATDHPLADVDEDGLPDLAVGRWPATTPAEVATLVAKVLDYESQPVVADAPTPGPPGVLVAAAAEVPDLDARRRIAIVAGVGGFGPLIDGLLETASRQAITTMIPADADVTVAFGSWRSPYCPDPTRASAVSRDGLDGPNLFWTYIGHGHPLRLDAIAVGQNRYPFLTDADLADAGPGTPPSGAGRPVGLLLACYTAAYDFPVPSLAERMVVARGGPIATFGASRIAMPFAMNVLGQELIRLQFGPAETAPTGPGPGGAAALPVAAGPLADRTGPPATLGELLLRGKRRLVAPAEGDEDRATLMTLGRLVSPKPKLLEAELAEHLYLFNLIGDPLLRLPRRAAVPVTVDQAKVRAGTTVAVRAGGLAAGPVRVEVVCRRDRATTPMAGRDEPPGETAADRAAMQATYEAANDRLYAAWTVTLDGRLAAAGGPLAVTIPVEASGPCHVRVAQVVDGVLRTGSCDVLVGRGETDASAR